MQNMVFYFTGTGNSLYAARQLEENPVSIPQVIRQAHPEFRADAIGIVAPVYGHEVPHMVREFLQKTKFHTAGNLGVGNDREKLYSMVEQCMPYIGYPRSLNAMNIIDEVTEKFENA